MARSITALAIALSIGCLLIPAFASGRTGVHVCINTQFGPALSARYTTCRKAKLGRERLREAVRSGPDQQLPLHDPALSLQSR